MSGPSYCSRVHSPLKWGAALGLVPMGRGEDLRLVGAVTQGSCLLIEGPPPSLQTPGSSPNYPGLWCGENSSQVGTSCPRVFLGALRIWFFPCRLLHESPDSPAPAGHCCLLLPGHPVQPLCVPSGCLRAQASRPENHPSLCLRPHPHG